LARGFKAEGRKKADMKQDPKAWVYLQELKEEMGLK
jgi:hypothetical protein